MTWRTGNKLGRTLYRDEVCVGLVDTPEIAAEIVAAVHAVTEGRKFWDHVDSGHPAVEREKQTAAKLAEATALWLETADEQELNAAPYERTEAFLTSAQPAAPARTEDPADRVLSWAGPAARANLGLAASARTECSCADELSDQPCPVHAQLFSPTDAEADALGLPRCPAAPARTEADEGSPIGRAFLMGMSLAKEPTRTEAEQAVLDAMATLDTKWLEDMLGSDRCFPNHPQCVSRVKLHEAELARRRLK